MNYLLAFLMLYFLIACKPVPEVFSKASVSSRTKRIVWVTLKKVSSKNYRRPAIVEN